MNYIALILSIGISVLTSIITGLLTRIMSKSLKQEKRIRCELIRDSEGTVRLDTRIFTCLYIDPSTKITIPNSHDPRYMIENDERYFILNSNGTRSIIIGRGVDCDLCIVSEYVSIRHLRMYMIGKQWIAEDCSMNGTTVNGERISDAIVLKDGDVLSLAGSKLVFRVGKNFISRLNINSVLSA
ncbi:MAG: FHA domain-containing protein [bacterium]